MPSLPPANPLRLSVTGSVNSELVDLYEGETRALIDALAAWLSRDGEPVPPIELHLSAELPDAGEQEVSANGTHLIHVVASDCAHGRHTIAHELCHVAQGVLDRQPQTQADAIPGEFLAERAAPALARSAGLTDEVALGRGPVALAADAAQFHQRLCEHLLAIVGEPDFRLRLSETLSPLFWEVLRYAAYAAGAAAAADHTVFDHDHGKDNDHGPFDASGVDLPDWARERFAGIMCVWARAAAPLPTCLDRAGYAAWRTAVSAQFTSEGPDDGSDGFDAYINNAASLYLYDLLTHLSGLGSEAAALRDELREFYYGAV
jgi:hypothetical protein